MEDFESLEEYAQLSEIKFVAAVNEMQFINKFYSYTHD